MSAALTPLQYVRPPAEPRIWSCFNDLLSSTQESYLTQVSNRLGMAAKALGLVAIVTLPFVVVSGMWGMNFERIPLHSDPYGFLILVFAQLALGLAILAGLKWRKIL